MRWNAGWIEERYDRPSSTGERYRTVNCCCYTDDDPYDFELIETECRPSTVERVRKIMQTIMIAYSSLCLTKHTFNEASII